MASNTKALTRAILATLIQSGLLLAAGAADSTGAASATDPTPAANPTPTTAAADNQWHLAVSPYLWLPGAHGDMGALGRDVGFRVSPTDLLSHFRFGLLGAVEARRNWLLLSTDALYMRLGADNAVPFQRLDTITSHLTARVFILTPKVGVRIFNSERVKLDALAGFRYWRFGETVNFSPSRGLNYSKSQNWTSPLIGGRIETPLSEKLTMIILGDVGGWGTGSQLEYQVVGLLNYKLKPKMSLNAGYRYLNVDYNAGGNRGGVVNLTLSGIVLGVTRELSKQ